MKNWKTTVSGAVSAIGGYIYFIDPTIINVIPEPYRTCVWKAMGFMAFSGIITMGMAAKDYSGPKPPPPKV